MSLTCFSCKVVFSVPELHQEHYKSDWHRYNLKRRLAELPSVTKEEFEKRAESSKEIQGNDARLSLRCEVCNKHFSTENAKNNHLKSKKHLDSLSEFVKDSDKKASRDVTRSDDKKTNKAGAVANDMDVDDDDGDWESCDDSDDDENVITEEEESIEKLFKDADYEVKLPSGAVLGHRSLAVYYRQNLKPVNSDTQQKVKKVLQQYKSLGYTGTSGPLALKVARDISYAQNMRQRYKLKLSMKMNKFQPHFRLQVMF